MQFKEHDGWFFYDWRFDGACGGYIQAEKGDVYIELSADDFDINGLDYDRSHVSIPRHVIDTLIERERTVTVEEATIERVKHYDMLYQAKNDAIKNRDVII